jgi:hypothetical protein
MNKPKRAALLAATTLVLLMAHGCKPLRDLAPVVLAPSQAVAYMHEAEPAFDFFSGRFSGTATYNGEQYPVAGAIRIRRDSAIYISVAPVLGIEVARILATPDTVKYLNRLESSYFTGDISLLNRLFNTNLDFHMLQAILTGSDLRHYSTDNFRVSAEGDMLLLHSPGRVPGGPGALPAQEPGTPSGTAPPRGTQTPSGTAPPPGDGAPGARPLEHNIWLHKDNYRILQTTLHDRASRHSIQARYPAHTSVDGQAFPSQLQLVFIDPGSRAELSITYSRTTFNRPQQMSFSVPRGYTPLSF